MANFNKVIMIGRLTRDPECKSFGNGGKVAKFGFAVSDRKKNQQTGKWDEVPMFIDVEAFNHGESGTLANVIEQYCKKGSMVCVEGKLVLDSWDDKSTGQKRTKHKILASTIQLIDTKGSNQGSRSAIEPGDASEPSGDSGPADSSIPF